MSKPVMIQLAEVIPPASHRHTKQSIEKLAESLKRFGQFHEIGVYEDNGLRMLYGTGRFFAAQQAGIPSLRAINYGNLSKDGVLGMRLAENTIRKAMSAAEIAELATAWMNLTGETQRAAAGQFGIAESLISDSLTAMANLTEGAQAFLSEHDVPRQAWIEIAKEHPEKQLDLANRFVSDGMTVKQLKAERKEPKPKSIKITFDIPIADYESMIQQIKDEAKERIAKLTGLQSIGIDASQLPRILS